MIRAKKYGLTYDEYVEQANIINKFVLPSGLEETELNTAIREEEWENLTVSSEKQVLLSMAQDLIDHWNCLWSNEHIVFFDHNKNRYDTNEVTLKGYLQKKYQYENITTSKMKEVLEQVSILLQNNQNYWRKRNEEFILCNNNLVSVLGNKVIPNTRTIYTDIYYPYEIMTQEEFDNFNGRAKSFMEEISCYDKDKNPDILTIIFECIGCMLSPIKPFGKLFIFYGSGANGKSLLLKLVEAIMGDLMTHSNILSVNDKFALEGVINGIANVTDDVGITTLKETGTLKSLIQGSSIEVNRKYKNSIWWKPNSQFIICCNEVPKISDTSPGMIRRLAFIPFEMQLPDNKQDIKLESKLLADTNNLRYILTGAIFAYRKAIQRGHLTEIEKQTDLVKDFLDENQSPIDLFFDHLKQTEGNSSIDGLCKYLDGKTTEEIYNKYKDYRENDKNIEPQKTFTGRFKRKLPSKIELKRHHLAGHSFTTYTLKE